MPKLIYSPAETSDNSLDFSALCGSWSACLHTPRTLSARLKMPRGKQRKRKEKPRFVSLLLQEK